MSGLDGFQEYSSSSDEAVPASGLDQFPEYNSSSEEEVPTTLSAPTFSSTDETSGEDSPATEELLDSLEKAWAASTLQPKQAARRGRQRRPLLQRHQ